MNIPIIGVIEKVLDKVVADKDVREQQKIEARKLLLDGEFKELEFAMNAIVMEAKSNDRWTSRARPAFLYVMYIIILAAFPMGVLAAFNPEFAKAVTEGVSAWLQSVPGEMWTLFGAGYLGYGKKRSDDKITLMGGKPDKLLGIF